jgi:6-phosphofructokinase
VLGHLQRGGKPNSHDRLLASRMGYCAANVTKKDSGAVVKTSGLIKFVPFKDQKVQSRTGETDKESKTLIKTLSL